MAKTENSTGMEHVPDAQPLHPQLVYSPSVMTYAAQPAAADPVWLKAMPYVAPLLGVFVTLFAIYWKDRLDKRRERAKAMEDRRYKALESVSEKLANCAEDVTRIAMSATTVGPGEPFKVLDDNLSKNINELAAVCQVHFAKQLLPAARLHGMAYANLRMIVSRARRAASLKQMDEVESVMRGQMAHALNHCWQTVREIQDLIGEVEQLVSSEKFHRDAEIARANIEPLRREIAALNFVLGESLRKPAEGGEA